MKIITFLFTLLVFSIQAQVVRLDPYFATENDTVTIIFDASEGNGELKGISQVYAHTGVITDQSTSPTDWRHVQGNWGTADAKVKMSNQGNDIHHLKIHIPTFYSPGSETIEKLAFVFRNEDGSKVGRSSDGSDIFIDLYSGNFAGGFIKPSEQQLMVDLSDSLEIELGSSSNSILKVYVDGNLINKSIGSSYIGKLGINQFGAGNHIIHMRAVAGLDSIADTIKYIIRPVTTIQNPSIPLEEGVTFVDDSTAYFRLYAPYKNFVFLYGDMTNWELNTNFVFQKETNGLYFWIKVENIDPNREYRYQYLIDDDLMPIANTFSELILSPWNDGYINSEVYPNMPKYPFGKTTQPVSVIKKNQEEYVWKTTNFSRPKQTNLVIYELLIRDFNDAHSFQAVIDSLSYLNRLGINAIELMPINEFEGNESWGYNPSFYFAPDKYYGPKNKLKELVDKAHEAGISVILDVVFNHSFGQSPQVRMYFDPTAGQWGQPAPNNPWFNEVAKHDFNVGYDYNHSSSATNYFIKRALRHWIDEYKIDGYRFDLSKGFTQKNTLGNTGAWAQYDADRIDILKDYANEVWSNDSSIYMILEHFAENTEEKELAEFGFMLWGNSNYDYGEAAMGYSSNLSSASYKERNWNKPHLVSYMESHDEERLTYKCVEYGANNSTYDVRNLKTALNRMELIANFFFTIPGPKMIWQFGEWGYDYSINYCPDGTTDPNCRTANKPIKWEYFQEGNRKRLFKVYQSLIHLKNIYPVFSTEDYDVNLSSKLKRINLNHDSMNVTVIGNFDINTQSVSPNFQHTGKWYEYYSGSEVEVSGVNDKITLNPGGYKLYTDKKIASANISSALEEGNKIENIVRIFPNPSKNHLNIYSESIISEIQIKDIQGKVVLSRNNVFGKQIIISTTELPSGLYTISVKNEKSVTTNKLFITK